MDQFESKRFTTSRTFYNDVGNNLGGNGKLCFARDGLIYYPEDAVGGEKIKIRWASIVNTKFDKEFLLFAVHHVRGKSHTFRIKDLPELQRIEQDCSRRLAEAQSKKKQQEQQQQEQQQPSQQQPQHPFQHLYQGQQVPQTELDNSHLYRGLDNSAMQYSAAVESSCVTTQATDDDDDENDDDDSASPSPSSSSSRKLLHTSTDDDDSSSSRKQLYTSTDDDDDSVSASTPRKQQPSVEWDDEPWDDEPLDKVSLHIPHPRPSRVDKASIYTPNPRPRSSFSSRPRLGRAVNRKPIVILDANHPSLQIGESTSAAFEESMKIIDFENEVCGDKSNKDNSNSDSDLFGRGHDAALFDDLMDSDIAIEWQSGKASNRDSCHTTTTNMMSEYSAPMSDHFDDEAVSRPSGSTTGSRAGSRAGSGLMRFLGLRNTPNDTATATDGNNNGGAAGLRQRRSSVQSVSGTVGAFLAGLESETKRRSRKKKRQSVMLFRQPNGLTATAGPRSREELRRLLRAAIIVAGMAAGSSEFTEEYPLSPDAYSILYTVGFHAKSTWFAWFVIIVQAGMLLVTFLDLMAFPPFSKHLSMSYYADNFAERLELPPGASVYVTASQFFGFLLTILVMCAEGDFVTGAGQLIRGYDEKIREEFKKATYTRWLLISLLQASTGALLLINSFILSMQSTTVIDLALNLTALHFVQEIDDKAFHIAKDTGLLGTGIKYDCEAIEDYKVVTRSDYRAQTIKRKRYLIGFMTICLFVPYFIVVGMQNTGVFLCEHLYVQFGDAYHPEMAHYSGLFHAQGFGFLDRKDQRTFYLDETNTFQIGYCDSEKAWTVSRAEDGTCDYIFKSKTTETFDIMQVANEDWVVKTEESGDVDVDWLKIKCNDCSTETCNPMYGTCSDSYDMCICNEGRHGINCQHEETCEWYALDQRTKDVLASVPGAGPLLGYEYRSASHKDPNLSFYGRPIYVPADRKTSTYKENIDSFIVFTGRRWVIYSLPEQFLPRLVEINGKPSNWTSEAFFEYHNEYSTGRNSFWAMTRLTLELVNLRPLFFSSPVDYGEDSDGIDLSTVTWMFGSKATAQVTVIPSDRQDISWMFPSAKEPVPSLLTNATNSEVNLTIISANPNDGYPMSAKFLCPECQTDEDCLNGGTCSLSDSSGGVCACPEFYDGTVCERLKNCVEAGGSCSDAGKCNEATGICHCDEGSYGRHCQLHSQKSLSDLSF